MHCSPITNEVSFRAFSHHPLSKLQLSVYTLQHLKKICIQTVTEQQLQIGNFILVTSLGHQICQFVDVLCLQQFYTWVVKHIHYVCSTKTVIRKNTLSCKFFHLFNSKLRAGAFAYKQKVIFSSVFLIQRYGDLQRRETRLLKEGEAKASKVKCDKSHSKRLCQREKSKLEDVKVREQVGKKKSLFKLGSLAF